jgi:hypothetical protein
VHEKISSPTNNGNVSALRQCRISSQEIYGALVVGAIENKEEAKPSQAVKVFFVS